MATRRDRVAFDHRSRPTGHVDPVVAGAPDHVVSHLRTRAVLDRDRQLSCVVAGVAFEHRRGVARDVKRVAVLAQLVAGGRAARGIEEHDPERRTVGAVVRQRAACPALDLDPGVTAGELTAIDRDLRLFGGDDAGTAIGGRIVVAPTADPTPPCGQRAARTRSPSPGSPCGRHRRPR